MKDYYSILGLEPFASEEEVRRAYRNLARQYHPDVNPSAEAARRFLEIHEAYEVLTDPDKRRQYDDQYNEYLRKLALERLNSGQGNSGGGITAPPPESSTKTTSQSQQDSKSHGNKIFFIVVAVMLFLGIADLPYGYYTILRWVVFIASGVILLCDASEKRVVSSVIFSLIMVMFNPIVPIYLEKETWQVIDALAGGIFAVTLIRKNFLQC